MQWGNLPVPGHLRGGAAVTAFFHHVCDCLCISRFERQFKIFADVFTLNFVSTSWLVCSQISWPSCLMGCITPILLKICSTRNTGSSRTFQRRMAYKGTSSIILFQTVCNQQEKKGLTKADNVEICEE